jgi:hypothetical protein
MPRILAERANQPPLGASPLAASIVPPSLPPPESPTVGPESGRSKPAIPLQSIEPRANVRPFVQTAGGYRSQYDAPALQSALVVQGWPTPTFIWQVLDGAQKSVLAHGICALHGIPVAAAGLH